jgi:DNA-binding IclR family transcriptional regulator
VAVVDLMHAATGHVILAHQTAEVSSRAIQIWSERHSAHAPRDLATHLTRIKRRGFEQRRSYEVDGVFNVSFPVLDNREHAIAALTIPFLQRIDEKIGITTVKTVLKRASSELTTAMGGTGVPQASKKKERQIHLR